MEAELVGQAYVEKLVKDTRNNIMETVTGWKKHRTTRAGIAKMVEVQLQTMLTMYAQEILRNVKTLQEPQS